MKNFFLLILVFSFSLLSFSQSSTNTNHSLDNSIIIIIHGDGDYLFHNRNGEAFLADEVVLNKSIAAAEQLTNTEVFIFHQKKKKFSFLFFPEDDLDLYYFRNGKLINISSRQRNNFLFEDEKDFFSNHASVAANNILLYYGHEIPVSEGTGYHASNKDKPFNISIFSKALEKFSPERKLDLIVLSTCSNGSPEAIRELAPKADYIIASPENLHLSYINPLILKRLNRYNTDMEDFVVEFSRSAFNELRKTTETVTAISAYKTAELSDLILELKTYTQNKIEHQLKLIENCDCNEMPGFNAEEASRGMIIFYNPPAFGKHKFKLEHSGWGCRKETEFTPASAVDKIIQARQSGLNQSQDQEK